MNKRDPAFGLTKALIKREGPPLLAQSPSPQFYQPDWEKIKPYITEVPQTLMELIWASGLSRNTVLRGLNYATGRLLVSFGYRKTKVKRPKEKYAATVRQLVYSKKEEKHEEQNQEGRKDQIKGESDPGSNG